MRFLKLIQKWFSPPAKPTLQDYLKLPNGEQMKWLGKFVQSRQKIGWNGNMTEFYQWMGYDPILEAAKALADPTEGLIQVCDCPTFKQRIGVFIDSQDLREGGYTVCPYCEKPFARA